MQQVFTELRYILSYQIHNIVRFWFFWLLDLLLLLISGRKRKHNCCYTLPTYNRVTIQQQRLSATASKMQFIKTLTLWLINLEFISRSSGEYFFFYEFRLYYEDFLDTFYIMFHQHLFLSYSLICLLTENFSAHTVLIFSTRQLNIFPYLTPLSNISLDRKTKILDYWKD
jgi:hypothetical protein